MSDQPTTLHALLIGINCYMDRTIDALPCYGNLKGCVSDVELMEKFLSTQVVGPQVRITKLTASGRGSEPTEPQTSWPTKANIVAAFRQIGKVAHPGDQVYIHYSGHGGRAVTLYPDVKGDQGLDESLVPTDYGQIENLANPEDRYIRDLEIAALLQSLVDNDLYVTLVMDSCHSGGANRGIEDEDQIGIAVRGSHEIDSVQRTPVDLVASPDELVAGWKGQGTRSTAVVEGWLPDPTGYTFLSACRSLELATEGPTPGGQRHGYLTYWLWDTLQKPMRNWEMVHQQVVSRVKTLNTAQTPLLQGAGDRAIFGDATIALPSGINVLKVEGQRVQLEVGQSGGVGVGAKFFIYPAGVTDFKQTNERLAVVEVTESSNTSSWATLLRQLGADAVKVGDQALLFDPGTSQQRVVRAMRGGGASADIETSALSALSTALAEGADQFVRLGKDGESADFWVAVIDQDQYQIRNGLGQPISNLPLTPISDPLYLLDVLTHLTKFRNVASLQNPDLASFLAEGLEVTLMDSMDTPLSLASGVATVKSGKQIYYLRIRNRFEPVADQPSDSRWHIEQTRRRTLNITVLNLSSDWSISRMIPDPKDAAKQFELGPGETLLLPRSDLPGSPMQLPAFRSELPAGTTVAEDIFKVFATTETTSSYDAMQLPPLTGLTRKASMLGAPEPQFPEQFWTTAQVHVRVEP